MEPTHPASKLAATTVDIDLHEQYRALVESEDRTISADLRRYIKGRVADAEQATA